MAPGDKGAGGSGEQRPQVRSSATAGKATATPSESKRGDTASKGGKAPMELPAQFGRYRVLKKLGGGGMGTVYLVENTELERQEALKVPHFTDGDSPHIRERFLREAKSAAKLDHPNLCPVWDAGVQDGVYYMTMRLLSGKLLSDFTGKAQPARKAVEIVVKLAQALAAAHDKGVIHRDLKPSNVMMVASVGPVIMDFGLAKEVQKADQKLTQAGAMLGTPAYMPPEQVNGELEQMGPPSDVYSLGVILFELLTGRLPFEGSMAMIFGQILYAELPLPSTLVPGLSPALDGICQKALAKAATDRYPSMNAFAAALQDSLHSTTATMSPGTMQPTAVVEEEIYRIATALPADDGDLAPASGGASRGRPRSSTVERSPRGTRKTMLGAGPRGERKGGRPFPVGLAIGGAVLGTFLCVALVGAVILFVRSRSSAGPDVSRGGQSDSESGAAPGFEYSSPSGNIAETTDGVLPVGADGRPLNFDFETGSLKDWTAEGQAFIGQPIEGDTVSARLRGANIRSNHQGRYWIGTFERRNDGPQGTLTSVPFKVTHPWASFLVGGGPDPSTCVELVLKDTGQVYSRTSGASPPIETMRRVNIDLRSIYGREIFIRVVDKSSGGWGHINFDDFRFHD